MGSAEATAGSGPLERQILAEGHWGGGKVEKGGTVEDRRFDLGLRDREPTSREPTWSQWGGARTHEDIPDDGGGHPGGDHAVDAAVAGEQRGARKGGGPCNEKTF